TPRSGPPTGEVSVTLPSRVAVVLPPVAVIVAVPGPTAVASPVALTWITAGSDEVHVAVNPLIGRLLRSTTHALSCVVCPDTVNTGVPPVIPTPAATCCTRTSALPMAPPACTKTESTPLPIAVTTPDGDTWMTPLPFTLQENCTVTTSPPAPRAVAVSGAVTWRASKARSPGVTVMVAIGLPSGPGLVGEEQAAAARAAPDTIYMERRGCIVRSPDGGSGHLEVAAGLHGDDPRTSRIVTPHRPLPRATAGAGPGARPPSGRSRGANRVRSGRGSRRDGSTRCGARCRVSCRPGRGRDAGGGGGGTPPAGGGAGPRRSRSARPCVFLIPRAAAWGGR